MRLKRVLKFFAYTTLFGIVAGVFAVLGAYLYVRKDLPDVSRVKEIELQVPLKIYSAEGQMIASFGEMRRNPQPIAQMPLTLRQAFVAVEDARFYSHYGIDPQGIARAVWEIITTGEKGSGGSTITQQLSRGLYLTPEVSYRRKLIEIFTALKLERSLKKDEILELYLNKTFLGQRAYGVAAAAEVYYGKTLDQLTIAESAMLAAIPKAPSERNPITNPKVAVERRNFVLQRMFEEKFISADQLKAAQAETDVASLHSPPVELEAPYIAELARLEVEKILGADKALNGGYKVYTSIQGHLQNAAADAVKRSLISYDRRHGWRGAEASVDVKTFASPLDLDRALEPYWTVNGLVAGVVTQVNAKEATLHLSDGQDVSVPFSTARWAKRYKSELYVGPAPKSFNDVVKIGDVVRVERSLAEDGTASWALSQLPKVQAAFTAIDPEDGAIRALIGGFSFGISKFNRATQSLRQPGSSFKPFVYSAALEKGFTTASIINDAPIVFEDASIDKVWKPQNDNEKFSGPTRMREAMVTSKNLVSVRLLDAIGVRFARRYIQKFGFTADSLPENLSMALGTNAAPPIAMARGYAAFANSGFLVTPYLIAKIEDNTGKVIFEANAPRACRMCPERLEAELIRQEQERAAALTAENENTAESPAQTNAGDPTLKPSAASAPNALARADSAAIKTASGVVLAPRAIDERNAYIITTMMRDVIKRGTGVAAMELGRTDLAGKTGTTNDHRDAWFSGFSAHMVASAWVGFDDFSSLGEGEYGGKAALPIWTDFMRVALEGQAEEILEQPTGVTTARINGRNGLLTSAGDPGGIMEVFRVEDLSKLGTSLGTASTQTESDPYELF
jgi:penicillin-binding protein 1A